MTDRQLRCEWCGRKFTRPAKKGPVPRFCKASHRQRSHEARKTERLIAEAVAQVRAS